MTYRPELAPVDGLPVPAGLPDGLFSSTILEDGTLRIDQADPRLLISAEVVDQAAFGTAHPSVTITMLNYTVPNGHVGALLKICGVNQQVVYRLTEWVPAVRAYIGVWPE